MKTFISNNIVVFRFVAVLCAFVFGGAGTAYSQWWNCPSGYTSDSVVISVSTECPPGSGNVVGPCDVKVYFCYRENNGVYDIIENGFEYVGGNCFDYDCVTWEFLREHNAVIQANAMSAILKEKGFNFAPCPLDSNIVNLRLERPRCYSYYEMQLENTDDHSISTISTSIPCDSGKCIGEYSVCYNQTTRQYDVRLVRSRAEGICEEKPIKLGEYNEFLWPIMGKNIIVIGYTPNGPKCDEIDCNSIWW